MRKVQASRTNDRRRRRHRTKTDITDADEIAAERMEGKPRVALLDGLPFANHAALQGRLLIDDPDGLGRAIRSRPATMERR